jgi:hypothetical protein
MPTELFVDWPMSWLAEEQREISLVNVLYVL